MFWRNSKAYGRKCNFLRRPSFWVIVKSEGETYEGLTGLDVKINVSSRSINNVFLPVSHCLLYKWICFTMSSLGMAVSMGNWYFSEWLIRLCTKFNLLPYFLSNFPLFFLILTSSTKSSMKYLLLFLFFGIKFEFLISYYKIWLYYIILVYSDRNKFYFPNERSLYEDWIVLTY